MALPTFPVTGRPMADVIVHGIQRRAGDRHKRSWIVRWTVCGRQRSRSFATKATAERFRVALVVAQQSGDSFDDGTGEPQSWQAQPDHMKAHTWVRRWLAEQWPEWAPRTRVSAVEALVRLVPLLVSQRASPPPPQLRAHLRSSLPPGGASVDDACESWLERSCLELRQLSFARSRAT